MNEVNKSDLQKELSMVDCCVLWEPWRFYFTQKSGLNDVAVSPWGQ